MRVVAGFLIVVGVLLALVAVDTLGIVYAGLLYVGLPTGLAVAFVVRRRYSPSKATVAGAVVAVGTLVLIILTAVVLGALSDVASGGDRAGTDVGGVVLFLLLLVLYAIPVAIAGGITSAIASLVGVRLASNG